MAAKRSVLVLNAGSSSLKYALYNMGEKAVLAMQGLVEQIGTSKGCFSHKSVADNSSLAEAANFEDHKAAMAHALSLMGLDRRPDDVAAVGHRVVHGGEEVSRPCIIDNRVKSIIEKCIPLAPLHNPPNLMGINVAQELLKCPQVAVFDTAFHTTMPPSAYLYGIPLNLYKDLAIRRYGFHGTSYQYLLAESARLLGKPVEDVNAIILHMGAGASMAAIKKGRCIDTTMGVTPLEGLVMATRSGDIDPAIVKILSDLKGLSTAAIDSLLNKQSGLLGLCGEKDMKTVVDKTAAGDPVCQQALEVYVHRVRKYLGAYFFHLGGDVDAIIFSAGIGERSAPVRQRVCAGLERIGISLDLTKNEEARKDAREIQAEGAPVKIMVVPTDEELCIAQQTLQVVEESKLRAEE